MRDFTFQIYRNLCNAILQRHTTITVAESLNKLPEKGAIIRHDVDKNPQNALIMAKIEKSLGINSTYYFRTVTDSFNIPIIEEIHSMGHEIGYHYEVLDRVNGDYKQAIKLFEHDIGIFPCQIRTICMHGNPMTHWDNRDLWKKYDYKKFGVYGEAYLSLDFSHIEYYSDTGRSWDGRYSVKDYTIACGTKKNIFTGTTALIKYISEKSDPVCIVTHPQRWNDTWIPWLNELVSQTIKNIGKSGIKHIRKKD